ncbi:hypothetical protein [Haliscomenobacter sp.]|uniref:hypothetical protein n=1 Tax=Haliscomenobacter sp. TaxID=2717303 RepID=UPI003BAB565E
MESELTITKYINDLKNGRDTAERVYQVRKSLWERAIAAYSKAQMVEGALKAACDRIETTVDTAEAINNTLIRAAKAGHNVFQNTNKARQASELLNYEMMDILCQAEVFAKKMDKFRIDVLAKLGADKPVATCIDDLIKTLADISKHAQEGLNKTLSGVSVIHDIQAAIADNCGINARLLSLTAQLKTCGMKDNQSQEELDLGKEYVCTVPDIGSMEDKDCGNQYKAYTLAVLPVCNHDFKSSFNKYRNETKNNFDKAKKKSEAALAWLNCTAEQKNLAEANFNACKAAYDAAVAAKKC